MTTTTGNTTRTGETFGFDFLATEDFRPGSVKIGFLSEKTVFYPLISFTVLCAVLTAIFSIVKGPVQEAIDILVALAAIFPIGIALAGGASASAWRWYAGFVVFTTATTAPVVLFDSFPFLLFSAPAVLCFLMFHRRAPHVLRAFGYLEKPDPAQEIFFFLLLTGISLALGQQIVTASKSLQPAHFSTWKYISLGIGCLVMYGAVYGVMFVIITRRLLDLKFLLIVPITFNALLLFLYFFPTMLANSPALATAIATDTLISIGYMTAMGLLFFYCRSTKFLLLFYLIFYLCYKAWGV